MYHPVMYDRKADLNSYWEASAGEAVSGCERLEGDESCDVAIIGAGYTGMSAGFHLARDTGLKVRILEAGVPGWGASGRNGGHCCFGGAGLDPKEVAKKFGDDIARRNIHVQRESIDLVDELTSTHSLEIDRRGTGEFLIAHRKGAVSYLNHDVEMWRHFGGFDCALLSREAFFEQGYRGPHVHGAMLFPFGFAVHPMKYARELARLAIRHGVTIHAASPVSKWSRESNGHRLHTPNGTVRAPKVLIATNGFTLDTLHPSLSGRLLPGIPQIVATRPLTEDELAAHNWQSECPLYDTRPMYSYLQMSADGCLVLGGAGGISGSPRSRESWKGFLTRRIAQMFPEWRHVEIKHSWCCFYCMSLDRLTHIGEIADDPGVYYSLAYHGNGVAMATWSGRAVAGLIAGQENAELPYTMRQPLGRFAVPALRKWWLYYRYSKLMASRAFFR